MIKLNIDLLELNDLYDENENTLISKEFNSTFKFDLFNSVESADCLS